MTAKVIKHEIFCGTGFYKRRENNYQEKKKRWTFPCDRQKLYK
ncbi:MAG: hypothetical protein PHW73_00760 [Atribacterota bacterium]|nr:hypothetical protein [Atribacterota bacterium]